MSIKELNSGDKSHLGGYGGGGKPTPEQIAKWRAAHPGARGGRGRRRVAAMGAVFAQPTIVGHGGHKHHMMAALAKTGLQKKNVWTAADVQTALAAVAAGARRSGKPPGSEKVWLRNFVRRHKIQLVNGAAVVGGPVFVGDDPTHDTREGTHRSLPKNVREAFIGSSQGQSTRAMMRTVPEAFIGGPAGQTHRAMLRSTNEVFVGGPAGATHRAMLRNVHEAFIGCATAIGHHVKKHRKPGKRVVVPGAVVGLLLDNKVKLHALKTGKAPTSAQREAWKQNTYRKIALSGGVVRGDAFVGDWLSSLAKIPGKVVSKAVEFTGRTLIAVPKASIKLLQGGASAVNDLAHGRILQAGKDLGGGLLNSTKAMVWDPTKKTFFPAKASVPSVLPPPPLPPGYPPGTPPQPYPPLPQMQLIPPNYYTNPNVPRIQLGPNMPPALAITPSVAEMAQQIAQRKAYNQQQANELTARLQLAQNRSQLAQLEMSEQQKVQDLADQASQAEAEAAQDEADLQAQQQFDATGDDELPVILGAAVRTYRASSLRGDAREAAVATEVLKTMGNVGKLAILSSPFKAFFQGAVNIYKAATQDPQGKEKVAALKDAAKAGDPAAEKAIDVLKIGKKATEEVTAAKVVETELNKAATKDAAKVSGCGSDDMDVVGLLPSSVKVISTIPGASDVYKLAKAGNPAMLKAVQFSADLLRKSAAGDASAKKTIADYGARAKKGDKTAQLFMAASAVAAAGLREEAQLKKANATPAVAVAKKKQMGKLRTKLQAVARPVKEIAQQALASYDASLAEGLALKLQFGGAGGGSPAASPHATAPGAGGKRKRA